MRRDALEARFGFNPFTKRAVEDPSPLVREGPFRQTLDEVRPRVQGPHDMSVDVLP